MFKLALLLCFTSALAKLDKPTYDYILYEQFNRVDDPVYPGRRDLLPIESAWVLNLNEDIEVLKLRVVTGDEVKEVFGSGRISGPRPRQGRRVKKDDPNKVSSSDIKVDDKAMIVEVMKVMNKFARKTFPAVPTSSWRALKASLSSEGVVLSTLAEPDSYLAQDTDEVYPSLKLYFQGEHTSLILRADGKQWHYILGPGLFPAWFHRRHATDRDAGGFVTVPSDVKRELCAALLKLLTTLLRLTV